MHPWATNNSRRTRVTTAGNGLPERNIPSVFARALRLGIEPRMIRADFDVTLLAEYRFQPREGHASSGAARENGALAARGSRAGAEIVSPSAFSRRPRARSSRSNCSRRVSEVPCAQQIREKSQHEGERNGRTHGSTSQRPAHGFRCRRHLASAPLSASVLSEPSCKPIHEQANPTNSREPRRASGAMARADLL